MYAKMQTSVALLAVSLLCFSVAEAQPTGNQEKEVESSLIPCKEQGSKNDNVQVFVILRMLEARLRDTEKRLEAKQRDTESQLEDLRKEMKDDRVAFGAAVGPKNTIGPFTTEITLDYSKVFSNTGAFNPSTGIFTTPVKGVYYFRFSGRNRSSKSMGLRLMKNGEQMLALYNQATGNRYETANNGMTLELEVGDQVYVRLYINTWLFDDIDAQSTFVGYLLFRV